MKPGRIESLKPLVVLLIVLAAGPEYFLGMELLALLDILGVGLFLIAHGYAIRISLVQFSGWLKRWAVPIQLLARPSLSEVRREPGLMALVVPVSLFYLSWCALGFLLRDRFQALRPMLAL